MPALILLVAGGWFGYQEWEKRKKEQQPPPVEPDRGPQSAAEAGPAKETRWGDMPDLRGMTESQATAALRAAGFADVHVQVMEDTYTCEYDDDTKMLPQGQICEQKPSAGTRVSLAKLRAQIVIEHDTYEHGGETTQEWRRMPDLVGKPLAEAQAILAAKGFKDDEFTIEEDASCARGTVCETAPKALVRKTVSYPGRLSVGK